MSTTTTRTEIDWAPLGRLLESPRRVAVMSHVRPDGDALGSCAAMRHWLRGRGHDAVIVNPSPIPPRYDFLIPEPEAYHRYGEAPPEALADRDLILILDLSSWGQLGPAEDFVRRSTAPRVVIDHHASQDDMGAIVLKDVSAEATGTLVLRAIEALGAPNDGDLTPAIARAILTAIAMDTGWFTHPNTRPETLATVGRLLAAGADLAETHRLLHKRHTMGRMRLTGHALSTFELSSNGRIAHATVTLADFERFGAIPADTEDLIDFLTSVNGVEFAALFTEQRDGGAKASLRSRRHDCAALAARFGGGGHRAAAGATLPGPLETARARVLEAIREVVEAAPPA